MHHYTIIAITLVILGFVFLFSLDMLIKPDTDQQMLKTVREHSTLIGAVSIAGAYYMYTLGEKAGNTIQSEVASDLPSYDDATSDILNM